MNEGGTERLDDRTVDGGTLRVLVIHDPVTSPAEISSPLVTHPRLEVIGEKPCDASTLAAVDHSAPDVVVIDASVSTNPTGLRLAMSIKAARPATGLVILVDRKDLSALSMAPKRQSPRCSFLLREYVSDAAAFAKVVEGAASGMVAIDPLVILALQDPSRQLLERLTASQLTALELLSSGYSDALIAGKLALDEAATQRLVESIYEDLHIPADPSIDQRVKAALFFISETANLRP